MQNPGKSTGTISILIPNCCNLGVLFRILCAVNGFFLCASFNPAQSWIAMWLQFLNYTILIEPIILMSMLGLCGLRQLLLVERAPAWMQRSLCVLLPVLMTILVFYFFTRLVQVPIDMAAFSYEKALFTAALFGFWLQHYFELRLYAYSPALIEAKLQALQARIRPHFLYNSLNAILALIRRDPAKAETTLQNLADLFRSLMREPRAMTTLADEIELCRQYLAIESVRLGERLQIILDTSNLSSDAMRHIQTPALLLQPLLENAVYYGVESATEPATISIRISRTLERIRVLISNPANSNTDANTPSSGNHMALGNIRERLALLYDVEAQLVTRIISDPHRASQQRFEVSLTFPAQSC